MSHIKIKPTAAGLIAALGLFAFAGESDSPDYLSFTAVGGNVKLKMVMVNDGSIVPLPDDYHMECHVGDDGLSDHDSWKPCPWETPGDVLFLMEGQTCYFRAKEAAAYVNAALNVGRKFVMTSDDGGTIEAGGSVMSLLDPTCAAVSITNDYAFAGLFTDCKILTTAPKLPAATLSKGCYQGMFQGCTALTNAPALPALDLAEDCYKCMFSDCYALSVAPELRATELAKGCYYKMFTGCGALTEAPELPARELTDNCYYGMFDSCTNLCSITVGFEDWSEDVNATERWVNGVSENGEFIYEVESLATNSYGVSSIPEGWMVTLRQIGPPPPPPEPPEPSELGEYLRFTAVGGDVEISLVAHFDGSEVPDPLPLECALYSDLINDAAGTWRMFIAGKDSVTVESGDTVYFRHRTDYDPEGNPYPPKGRVSLSEFVGWHFVMNADDDGTVVAGGNVMSLVDPTCASASITNAYAFARLFEDCRILTDAPELPATNLAAGCYHMMFNGCTALTNAPALPAMTLADSCYYGMFDGCSALTVAPDLMARELSSSCYGMMFCGCSSLREITVGFTDWCDDLAPVYQPTHGWCDRVAEDGVFTCPSSLPHEDTYIRSADYIPWGDVTVVEPPDAEITDFKIIGINVNDSSVVITVQVTLAEEGEPEKSVLDLLEVVRAENLLDLASMEPKPITEDMIASVQADSVEIRIPKTVDAADSLPTTGFFSLRRK